MPDQLDQIIKLLKEMYSEAYARGWREAIATLEAKAPARVSHTLETSVVGIGAIGTMAVTSGTKNFAGGGTAAEAPSFSRPSIQPTRGRPAKAISLVQTTVQSTPGLKGVEIVRALEMHGTPVLERTVRTCLRRLREDKTIWQRKGRWYPRPVSNDNSTEEVADTHLL